MNLDGHYYHAGLYYKDKFEEILGHYENYTDMVKAAMESTDPIIKQLRQESKGGTFAMSLTTTQYAA